MSAQLCWDFAWKLQSSKLLCNCRANKEKKMPFRETNKQNLGYLLYEYMDEKYLWIKIRRAVNLLSLILKICRDNCLDIIAFKVDLQLQSKQEKENHLIETNKQMGKTYYDWLWTILMENIYEFR